MSIKTCGGCKHLGRAIEAWDEDREGVFESGYYTCNLINLKRKKNGDKDALAYSQDASDYVSTLCVKQEFGCAEWAAKP